MRKSICFLFSILFCSYGYAHDIEVDGIFYNYNQSSQSVSVTYKVMNGMRYSGCYSGNIIIPSEIIYKGKKLTVESIGKNAFENCVDLLSINLPNSIITIEQQAFKNCKKLSKIDFPKSLKTIESEAFDNCRDIKTLYIPANVTKVENFYLGRNNLLSTIYIEDGDEKIDFFSLDGSFPTMGVRNIYIGRPRKTGWGYTTLSGGTYNPKILGIGKNVVSEHFESVTSLEKIYSKIEDPSTHHVYFSNSTYLNSTLYVPMGTKEKYVESEGWKNFFIIEEMDTNLMWDSNTEMEGIESPEGDGTRESPYNVIGLNRFFEDNLDWNQNTEEVYVTGYVLYGGFYNGGCSMGISDLNNETNYLFFGGNYYDNMPFTDNDINVQIGDKVVVLGKFKQNSGNLMSVSNSAYLISINGVEGNTTPKKKCEIPDISYEAGRIKFSCTTEGVEFVSEIKDTDINKYTGSIINLSITYNISVYATKDGYENSDVAKAILCWIDVEPKSEGLSNDVAQVRANAALIQSHNGIVTVSGLDTGTIFSIYSVSGHLIGSAKTNGNKSSLVTNLKSGDIAIVKIGDKSVKVVMQ